MKNWIKQKLDSELFHVEHIDGQKVLIVDYSRELTILTIEDTANAGGLIVITDPTDQPKVQSFSVGIKIRAQDVPGLIDALEAAKKAFTPDLKTIKKNNDEG